MYWCIGTTSFRVGNHIVKNKMLLTTLLDFWKTHSVWDDTTQPDLYDLARLNGLVKGTALRKDKDARQITSGLVDLGLVTKRREITEIGQSVLDIQQSQLDDLFLIEEDNYVYLKQFLKVQMSNVRPFIALIYLLEKLDYLTYDEFTYLLPICNNAEDVKEIVSKIKLVREGKLLFNDVMISQILKEEKIKCAIDDFSQISSPVLDDFVNVDMNRKSTQYSEPLEIIYKQLLAYKIQRHNIDNEYFISLKECCKQLSSNLYKQYVSFFNLGIKLDVANEQVLMNYFDSLRIMQTKDIESFNREFAQIVHLCKWRSTLYDYADLNRRYFMLPNIIKFGNNKFELDIIPKYVFMKNIDILLEKPIIEDFDDYRNFLQTNYALSEIDSSLDIKLNDIIPAIRKDFNIANLNEENIKTFIDDKKLERMNQLIDEYFMPEQLIKLLEFITERNDKALKGYANIEPDVSPSTLFEYFTAIAWYHISERKGNLLKFMNLKLDANLLPITHAPGYFSDIVFRYDSSQNFEKHDLMIEVTLADSTGQRRMEMEPVSRHLVNYKNAYSTPSYALFVANELHKMVLSDFRSRKTYFYEVGKEVRQGLKIIPLSTTDMCTILHKGYKYNDLYSLFDKAYTDTLCNDIEWYDKCIKEVL